MVGNIHFFSYQLSVRKGIGVKEVGKWGVGRWGDGEMGRKKLIADG
jgi:hypothetical protein